MQEGRAEAVSRPGLRCQCWRRRSAGRFELAIACGGGLRTRRSERGRFHTCGIAKGRPKDGHPYRWGANEKGQLGIDRFVTRPVEVEVNLRFGAVPGGFTDALITVPVSVPAGLS